jgi:hypothetical protein
MILLTTTLSLRAKREGSYVRRAPSAQAVFDRNCAVNQVVRTYGQESRIVPDLKLVLA